jgi:hypothetical protein
VIPVHVIEANPTYERNFCNRSAIKTGDKDAGVEQDFRNGPLLQTVLNGGWFVEQHCINSTGDQFQCSLPFLELRTFMVRRIDTPDITSRQAIWTMAQTQPLIRLIFLFRVSLSRKRMPLPIVTKLIACGRNQKLHWRPIALRVTAQAGSAAAVMPPNGSCLAPPLL